MTNFRIDPFQNSSQRLHITCGSEILRASNKNSMTRHTWSKEKEGKKRLKVRGHFLLIYFFQFLSYDNAMFFCCVCVCKVYYYKHTIWFQILQEVIDNLETCILNLPPSVTNLPNIVTRWFNLFKLSGDSTLFTLSKFHVPLRVGACHVKSPS